MKHPLKRKYSFKITGQIYLFGLYILFSITSCESLLHEEEISIGKIENYEQLVTATGGLHGMLTESFFGDRYIYYPANIKGDDLTGISASYWTYYFNIDCNPTTRNYNYSNVADEIHILWKNMYRTIASANNIINQFNITTHLEEREKEILGEVYLIRAFCYFRLTRTYGQVPLILNIDIDYNVPKPSFKEIYELIESDLKTARKLLPVNNSSARVPFVTPHKGTAKALLAEVYLSWAGYPCKDKTKYALAAKEAGEAIDSAEYFGFRLLDDFADLWSNSQYYNSESVFSLYSKNVALSGRSDAHSNIYSGFYNNDAYTCWYIKPDLNIETFFYGAEINFFNCYPPSYRKEITFYTDIYVPYYPFLEEANQDTGFHHIDIVGECDRIAYRKFYYDATLKDITQTFEGTTMTKEWNFFIGSTKAYLFRYAHTLLTYAEASARSGKVDPKAYECVNMIRRRANKVDVNALSAYDLQPGLTPEEFADSIVWERAWELAGEPEGRWFDLIRLEMVEDLPGLRNPYDGGPPYNFDKSEYFFSPPAQDTILNSNLGVN